MSDVVNGRPSWISSTNAIWSNPDNPTNWVIEKLDRIRENKIYILAKRMFFGQEKIDNWRLCNVNELKIPNNKNGVISECLFEKGKRQRVY